MTLQEAGYHLWDRARENDWFQGVGIRESTQDLILYCKTRLGSARARREYGNEHEGYPLWVEYSGTIKPC